MDITVRESDQRRGPGHLSRQEPPALRWALYEAAQAARRPSSPDRPYYEQLSARIGGNRACIAIERKMLKRSYHLLRALGDRAPSPSPDAPDLSRGSPTITDEPRPPPEARCRSRDRETAQKERAAATHLPEHPITHHVSGSGATPGRVPK
jgi:hypothetical protein